jgi:hypothetical protein
MKNQPVINTTNNTTTAPPQTGPGDRKTPDKTPDRASASQETPA